MTSRRDEAIKLSKRTPNCFLCGRFASTKDVVLLRHKKSGIRRWFHPSCTSDLNDSWEQVDSSLGETFDESRERARLIVKGKPTKPQKPALDSEAMLTIGDVARFLNLHITTVRRWSKKGILKSYRIGFRGDRRFRREDVEGLLKEAELPIRERWL